jgi:quercetin dioxygenase-like cupin family protein
MKVFSEELIRIGQLEIKFLINGGDSQGALDVFEMVVPPQARVPAPHSHTEVDEFVQVIEGTLTYTVGGEKLELGPGQRCVVKRGVVHHFINAHAAPVRALVTLGPAKIGPGYFREIATVVNAGGPPDIARIKDIMARHGLVPAAA